MELWREDMKMSAEERERRIQEHKKNIVRESGGFYSRGKSPPYTNLLGSPENRRAAGIFFLDL